MTDTDPQPAPDRWHDAVRRAKDAGLLEDVMTRQAQPVDGDEDATVVMRLADHVRDYVLRAEDTSTPYRRLWSESAHPVPIELDDDELTILAHLATETNDWRLRVRCVDILAIRATGVARVDRMVDMLVALRASLPEGTLTAADFTTLDRAFAVAGFDSRTRKLVADIESGLVQRAMTSTHSLQRIWVSQHLRQNRRARGRAREIAKSFDRRFAESAERLDGEEAAEWFFLAGDRDSAHGRMLDVVLGLQHQAEQILAQKDPDEAQTAAYLIELALQRLRRVPVRVRSARGHESLFDQLVASIRVAGKLTLALSVRRGIRLPDLQPVRDFLVENIAGLDPFNAILVFLQYVPLGDYLSLKEAAEQANDEGGFLRVPRATLEDDGRKSSASDAASDPDHYGMPASVWEFIMRARQLEVIMLVQQVLQPAWAALRNQHALTLTDFVRMANYSGLVPPGRERMVGRALYYGFHGDFLSALQLLSPQVENLLRYHLGNAGVRTSHMEDGIEQENGLSTLVESEKVESIFGHDEAFEIRALFSGDGGANLRNQSAHGLLADVDEHSPYPFYAWWVTWKLVIEEFGNTERDAAASANREPADPPEASCSAGSTPSPASD